MMLVLEGKNIFMSSRNALNSGEPGRLLRAEKLHTH